MNQAVIDASVVAKWFIEEKDTDKDLQVRDLCWWATFCERSTHPFLLRFLRGLYKLHRETCH